MPLCNILKNKIERVNHNQLDKVEAMGKHLWTQNREAMSTLRSHIKYRNIVQTVKTIWREEGAIGFFRGLQFRMAIQSVSSGIGWGTYQLVKGLMIKHEY